MSEARSGGFDWNVGSAIGMALSTLSSNFVSFVGLAFLIGLPNQLLTLADAPEYLTLVVDLVLGQVVTITLIYGTVQSLRGRPASITECLRDGVGRLPAAIGVALLAGLGIVAGLLLLLIPGRKRWS